MNGGTASDGRELARMVGGPSGTVAFLFTDIEGSTFRWEAFGDAMKAAVRRHDALLRASIERHGGHIFKTVGDAFCAAFNTVPEAAAAALDAQRALAAEDWSAVDGIFVRAAIHLGEADEREGDYFGSSVNRVARLLAVGHGGQILLSAAAKHLVEFALPADALLRDLGEHHLKDIATPERVYQLVAAGLADAFASLRSIGVVPHNLPLQITNFVGRASELEEIAQVLDSTRLLTLVGAGGVGKTRLAVQASAAILDRFSDGVWLIELADVREPNLVAAEFAAVLSAAAAPGKSVVEALIGALRHKHVLLIVDNCEHVIEEAAAVVDGILRRAHHVRIIATSRQPLHITGEFVRRVASLAIPPSTSLPAAEARTYDAIALFEERSRAASGSFVLTNENAPVVADICRSLDGIPLAIELAVPKLAVLSLNQLSGRLNERLRLLSGGNRTALRRQQTLRALIGWSYDLLDGAEQRLFRLLAPFAGGWTLESAEAVCSGGGLEETDVLELLASLVEKSLVVADVGGEVPRYHFLETIREYAEERLSAGGDEPEIRERHARHQAAYVRDLERLSLAMEDRAWQTRMLAELDNIRVALDWALVRRNDPALGLEMLSRLVRWRLILLPHEARRWFKLAVAAVDDTADPSVAADAFVQLATATIHSDAPASEQIAVAQNAVDAARRAAAPEYLGRALGTLGLCLRNTGRVDEADAVFREAADALGAQGEALHRATLYANWASNDHVRGDVALARERLHISLGFGRAGSTTVANALATLAEIEFASGDRSRALALALEAKAAFVALDLRLDLGTVSCNLAGYAIASDEFDEAWTEIADALAILRGVGSIYLTIALEHCAVLATLTGDQDGALRLLGYTDAYYNGLGIVREVTERTGFERARTLLLSRFGPDVVAQRMHHGAAMTEELALSCAQDLQLRRERVSSTAG